MAQVQISPYWLTFIFKVKILKFYFSCEYLVNGDGCGKVGKLYYCYQLQVGNRTCCIAFRLAYLHLTYVLGTNRGITHAYYSRYTLRDYMSWENGCIMPTRSRQKHVPYNIMIVRRYQLRWLRCDTEWFRLWPCPQIADVLMPYSICYYRWGCCKILQVLLLMASNRVLKAFKCVHRFKRCAVLVQLCSCMSGCVSARGVHACVCSTKTINTRKPRLIQQNCNGHAARKNTKNRTTWPPFCYQLANVYCNLV